MVTKIENFQNLTYDILSNKKFNKLKYEPHHGITRYEHSLRVAKWTYLICDSLHMQNRNLTTRAALLHDFYLDEELKKYSSPEKLKIHPNQALKNSLKYFKLDPISQNIISTHMFPCNSKMPQYKESWLVSGVDKVVGAYEMLKFKGPLYIGIYTLFLFELITLQR